MTSFSDTTIAALATAPAPAGVAVVRISGPGARAALTAVFRAKANPADDPRRLLFGDFIDAAAGTTIDSGLAVFMPGPNSFTGEDVAELQCHGSPILVQRLLRSLFAAGVRAAEPGEFTKRAFLNGKLDLVQAEAIADLINATTDRAAAIAQEQLGGKLSSALETIGEPLRNTVAELEAGIDFSDEDIEPESLGAIRTRLVSAAEAIETLLGTYAFGHAVKEGFRVLLCGRPNVGKSSLLNLLIERERAIVTPIAGTTRDFIEEEAIIRGYRFLFCDTAGITETTDVVERIGIERAKERIGWADLVLFVVDADDASPEWRTVLDTLRGKARNVWMVVNKIDLNPSAFGTHYCDSTICQQNFFLSAKTRSGLDTLTTALVGEVEARQANAGEASLIVTNERQRNVLERSLEAVRRAIRGIQDNVPVEFVVAETRIALGALEEIVGRTYTEDILGRIFSKFCIGK